MKLPEQLFRTVTYVKRIVIFFHSERVGFDGKDDKAKCNQNLNYKIQILHFGKPFLCHVRLKRKRDTATTLSDMILYTDVDGFVRIP